MQRVAAVRRLRQAKKTCEHVKAANSGSEDPEDLRVTAAIVPEEEPVVEEEEGEQSGEESEEDEEGEGRNRSANVESRRKSLIIPPNHVETQPQPPPKRKRTQVAVETCKYKYLSIGKYEIYYI
jgi:hypothetical protein